MRLPLTPRCRAALLLLLAGAVAAGAFEPPSNKLPSSEQPAARCAPGDLPPAAELEAAGATIGAVVVCAEEIFDLANPDENRWVYRAADALHRRTRKQVVERQLLFRSGDPFRADLLAESERLLRTQRTFYAVRVLPIAYHDGVVDVGVTTRDNWSLKPSVNFKRSGGTNTLNYKIQETNLLGLGKNLTVEREANVDRTSLLLQYSDPQLFGTRFGAELDYSDNSDGRSRSFALERPFFALDTRWALGARVADASLDVPRYALGHERDRFHRRDELVETWFGRSAGRVAGETTRFRFGFTFDESEFAPVEGFPDAPIPANRKIVYPWVSWQRIEDRFVVVRDLDRIDRPEDLNLGWNLFARAGLSSERWGADRTAFVFQGSATRGARLSDADLLLVRYGLDGRIDSGRPDPWQASLDLRYFRRTWNRQALFAELALDVAHALEQDRQLLLGGDVGLRGYPLRYQEGDRRLLLTLEQRWYGEREYFKVVRFGAAAFADLGRAWFAGRPAGPEDRGWLADLGVGLRVAPSRTSHANVIRIELAAPLKRDGAIDSVQYLVTTSETF